MIPSGLSQMIQSQPWNHGFSSLNRSRTAYYTVLVLLSLPLIQALLIYSLQEPAKHSVLDPNLCSQNIVAGIASSPLSTHAFKKDDV
jgi:hypothetical protein